MPASSVFAATGTGWVIDASITMPWFFPDEATPFTEALLDTLGKHELWAPTLWVLECTNVLQSAQRRRRIDATRRAEIAGELSELPVRLDSQTPDFVGRDRLAFTHGLAPKMPRTLNSRYDDLWCWSASTDG